MNYWQIAAGSDGRDYSDYFLKYGMAFAGGEEPEDRFSQLAVGDIVILKMGMTRIKAAGVVVARSGKHSGNGDKDWLLDFDGWELPAWVNVDWHVPDSEVVTDGLTRTTIERSWKGHNNAIADGLITNYPPFKFQNEPESTNPVTDDEIVEALINEGLRVSDAQVLNSSIYKIRLLAEYYYHQCKWTDVREHETRTFLVIPLLLALGWSEQQIKIEYPCTSGRIDIALFSKPFHNEKTKLRCVIETKDFSKGLDNVEKQAQAYAQEFPDCRSVIVTSGYRYKIYLKQKGVFGAVPDSYLNLIKPTDRFPLEPTKIKGAIDAIKWLLPD